MLSREFDSFDDLQCEDVHDENYVIDNDYDDNHETECVSYEDLIDRDLNFEDF